MRVFEQLVQALKRGEDLALVTVVRAQGSTPQKAGRHMLVWPDGSIFGTIGGGTIEHEVCAQALKAIKGQRTILYEANLAKDLGMCCGGSMEVLIEPMGPKPELVLFGGGHVNEALAPMAVACGFDVTIIDEREEFSQKQRFPPSCKLICQDPVDSLQRLTIGPQSYLLIVTHLHRTDEELLRALVGYDSAYLGMIGSRAKVIRFTKRLLARGITEKQLARVHMPIGLDIGAVTPAEIAVSILSELIKVRRQGSSSQGSQAMSIAHEASKIAEKLS